MSAFYTASLFPREPDPFAWMIPDGCIHCGSIDGKLRQVGPNVGLYCVVCNRWQIWIPHHIVREAYPDFQIVAP